jgi:hypothetical protein
MGKDGEAPERDQLCRRADGRSYRRRVRWSQAMKDTFLDHLALTCNVVASAALVPVHVRAAYNLRRRDAAFAEGWSEALEAGYESVELMLVAHALRRKDEVVLDPATGEPFDVAFATALLASHRSVKTGVTRGGGRKPRVATAAETDGLLLRKLQEIKRRRDAAA